MNREILTKGVASFRDDLNRRKGQRDSLQDQKRKKEQRVTELKHEVDNLRQVARLLNLAGDYARRESKETMEKLVTNALKMVFQGDHIFTSILRNVRRDQRPSFQYPPSMGENR